MKLQGSAVAQNPLEAAEQMITGGGGCLKNQLLPIVERI